ncbi:MAG: hypothetical protein J1E01_06795 [Acetatifactor sp.]|nr:hypothetical protein [Acetatifactor sp.]
MGKDTIIRRYLSEVGDKLSCPKPLKTTFLGELRERIDSFQSLDGEVTMEALCEEFGSPEEIADGFFNREDYEELLRKTKTRVVRWRIVSALVTVILLVAIVFIVSVIQESAGTFTVTNPY